jgi:hypothetical protein
VNRILSFIDLCDEIVSLTLLFSIDDSQWFVFLVCLAVFLAPEQRYEPGDYSMGRCVKYPMRKVMLDPFRRQIFTEDIQYDDIEPYLLTLKLAPKFFLPALSQVTKS